MEFITSLCISLTALIFAIAAHRKPAPQPIPVHDESAAYAARRRAELAAKKGAK